MSASWKIIYTFLYNLANFTLRIYLREKEKPVYINIYICTCISRVFLFQIVQSLKESKYPLTIKRLNKVYYTHKTEHSSAIKQFDTNENTYVLLIHITTWKNVSLIMLNERKEAER